MATEAIHKYGCRKYFTEHEPGMPEYLVRLKGPACGYDDSHFKSCDYQGCFESETADIVEGTSDQLRPMYLDLRHEVVICRKCYEAGKHLDETEAARADSD